jgi:hypothetical protein
MVTMEEYTAEARMSALAAHLGLELEAGEELDSYITEESYTANSFDAEGGTYMVLTDDEADEAVREYIESSLWAFNADFLAGNTGLPSEVFESLQNDKYEDANDPIHTIVTKCGDFDRLVRDAVMSDGRGHFLAQYDGVEDEEGDFFIYRTN